MKKFALSLKWMNIFLSVGIVYLILKQFKRIFQLLINNNIERKLFFGIEIPNVINDKWYLIILIFSSCLLIYLIFTLNLFRKITDDLLKNQIFSIRNGVELAKVGKRLFVFGIILVGLQIMLYLSYSSSEIASHLKTFEHSSSYSFGYHFGYILGSVLKTLITIGIPIFMGSLFMFIISHLIGVGHLLKEENELTI
jgi:hypothetical protein